MGFWKRNKEKITADTISGLLIRVLAGGLLFVLGGLVIRKFVPLQVDNTIIKELIDLAHRALFLVYCILILFLREILNWLGERRQEKNKEWELKNENLRLEIELGKQKQQSLSDQEE